MLKGCTPWPEDLAAVYRARGYWEDKTIPGIFRVFNEDQPDYTALKDESRSLSYRELWEESTQLAAQFYRLGLQKGDRVVFQLPNCCSFFSVFLALTRIGVIPVLALPPHREEELIHFAKFSAARALFIPERARNFDFRPMAENVRSEASSIEHVLVLGEALKGQTSLTTLLETQAESDDVYVVENFDLDPEDVVLMLLSGGTTALPKLIPRTHNDYVYNFKRSAQIAKFNPDTVLLAVLPLAHNYTLGSPGALGALSQGGRVVISSGVDCESVFSTVEREGVTAIPAAVPLVVNWLNDPKLDLFSKETLELVQNGGARLSPELRDRLRKRLECRFQEVYGTAEGLLNFTRLDDPDDKVLKSSGAPMCDDDEIKVIDLDGNEVPDGEAGELIVRGPYTIRGYYNAPETNIKSFTSDGFYRMGDIVKKHGRYLYTEGRKNDLINRGGEKISTDEIENLILKHPAIHCVAVVAMPDEVFGEKACAFVSFKPGRGLAFEELKEFLLEQRIAKFKLPERLEVLSEFPLSPAGKILRRNLRDMVTAKLAEEQNRA